VIPAIVSEPAALFASAQVPPLSTRWIVTVVEAAVAVAEQFVNPEGSVIVGAAGTVKPAGSTAVMVSAESRAAVGPAAKPTVHVAVAPAARVDAEKLTDAGAVAALIVTADAGFAATVSVDVLTLKVVFARTPAEGFV